MIITLTGHRDIEDETKLAEAIYPIVGKFALRTPVRVRWGGAPGADIIFAEVCHELEVSMDLYLPDPFYEARYIKNGPWRKRFDDCWSWSENVLYSAENNDWRNNFKRNIDMLTGANFVLAAYKYGDIDQFTASYRPRKGGTAHGIQTALKLGFKLGETLIHIPA